jgi:hypothetical protein
VRKCSKGHNPVMVKVDLSKAYRNDDYKTMWQVRCDVVPNSCEFSDYHRSELSAELCWQKVDISAIKNMEFISRLNEKVIKNDKQ